MLLLSYICMEYDSLRVYVHIALSSMAPPHIVFVFCGFFLAFSFPFKLAIA